MIALRRQRPPRPAPLPTPSLGHPHPRNPPAPRRRRRGQFPQRRDDPEQPQKGFEGEAKGTGAKSAIEGEKRLFKGKQQKVTAMESGVRGLLWNGLALDRNHPRFVTYFLAYVTDHAYAARQPAS